jgi:cytochrome P450
MMPGYYQLREVRINPRVSLHSDDQHLTFIFTSQKATASVTELVAERDAGKRLPAKPDEGTVLDLLLTPRPKHNHDIPGPDVLVDEGCAFIVGGSDTTGYTMEGATYLLLSHPECLKRLRDELDAVRPAIRDYDLQTVLELPFLVCSAIL